MILRPLFYGAMELKTVVKCNKEDEFDKEKDLAMAIVKRLSGNKGNYYNIFKEFCK